MYISRCASVPGPLGRVAPVAAEKRFWGKNRPQHPRRGVECPPSLAASRVAGRRQRGTRRVLDMVPLAGPPRHWWRR